MRLHVRQLLALLASTVIAMLSHGETAMVRSGTIDGQGWVFLDRSGCWLATPAHVVSNEAGILAIGPNGRQGFAIAVHIHPTEDLALALLSGDLATHCPGSPKGDLDSRPTLRRALGQALEINFERRVTGGGLDTSGVDVVPLQIVAIPESGTAFTVRPTRPNADELVQTDSGSPVRMRGLGLGDSGYPLGLILSVIEFEGDQFINVLRMDQVRAFHEALSATANATPKQSFSFDVTGFTGETMDSGCSPLNLIISAPECGWKVRRGADRQYPSIIVRLSETAEINGVQLALGDTDSLAGASVSVRRSDGNWSAERYCATPSKQFACRITPTRGQEVRVVLNAISAEVLSLIIE